MKKAFKIAVYSGEVPSTVFIERLISGISRNGCQVYLFGGLKKRTSYNKNVRSVTYSENKIQKLWHFLKYDFLLFLFRNKDKKKLDSIIKSQSENRLLSKTKYYPVLWNRPDIFHIQWAKSIDDWVWVQKFGMKLIVSLRGAHINYSPVANTDLAEAYRNLFPAADGFHAVSKAIAREAEKYGAASEKIRVIYSGLDLNQSGTETSGKEKNSAFKILSVGRNHWKKGYNYALDTVKILKDNRFHFEYTIIGGKDSEELQYQVADLKLENEVQLLGQIPFAEVQKQMKTADVLLLSSVEEGIANVVLEAMQLGILVLTTDCGGMNEVIENEKNGFIVPVRNPQKMTDAIIKIISLSKEEKEKIIQKAKTTIERNHTDTRMVSDMMALYKNVLNQ